MHENTIVLALIGTVMSVLGVAAIISPGFAEWYVKSSGKGRLWARILGEERAIAAMRLFFGPLTAVIGLVCFLLSGVLTDS
jgi:hypothetical protein